jgi:EAL domain-containing protein (putative c-di-GMP-specific phosphodiesterase class I)
VEISASPLRIGDAIEGAVVVFRDITEEKAERARVERELAAQSWIGRIREALDEERLVLYTQPIVPLRGGSPSEELLLRMIGRDGELIVPHAFLGVAETHGLIAEIDRWVVRQAIHVAATGRRVDVNVSAESMMSVDLMALIAEELEMTGVDPANLVFEITETALVRDMEKGHAFAAGINALGCSVALDDFGTGFGTFTHVKKLSVQQLKIDIEFVRGLCHSAANQHVVRTIVNLAQGFGCETVAEGVEDVETLQLLRDLGVDYAQGYLMGRPAPITDTVPAVPTLEAMGVA